MALIITILIFAALWAIIKATITPNPQSKKQLTSRSTLSYSPHTIRSTPKPQPTKQKEIVVKTLDIPDDNEEGVYESKIAGITFHCKQSDKGIFHGVIYNEANNPYNSKAMAIVSMNKKLIGYIPEDELDDYYDWNNGLPVTCVGFIKPFTNDKGREIVFGRVYSIKPCNSKFVESTTVEIEEDIRLSEYLSFSHV